MQDKTTITLTIDEDPKDDLIDVVKFILFARRIDVSGPIGFRTDKALQVAIMVARKNASNLGMLLTHNTPECEDLVQGYLGYDPFFNDDGDEVEPEKLVRKLGLRIQQRPKSPKKKARTRGGKVRRVVEL